MYISQWIPTFIHTDIYIYIDMCVCVPTMIFPLWFVKSHLNLMWLGHGMASVARPPMRWTSRRWPMQPWRHRLKHVYIYEHLYFHKHTHTYIYLSLYIYISIYIHNKFALCYVVAYVQAKFRWTAVTQTEIWLRWGSCALVMEMQKQSQTRGKHAPRPLGHRLHSGSSSLADLRCHRTEWYNGVGGRRCCANFSHGAFEKSLRQQFRGWSWTWMWTSCWLVGHPGTLVDDALT